MEKHDNEKGETLTRDEMKHTKGGAKVAELAGGLRSLKEETKLEEREGLIGGFADDAKEVLRRPVVAKI